MKKMVLCLMLIVALSGLGLARPLHPDLNTTLSHPIAHYAIKATNLLQAMAQFSSEFDVPTGLEWQDAPNAERAVLGEWSNTTLLEVLRRIVAQDPKYELSIANDVVHIRPRSLDREPRDFLNSRLSSFVSKDEYTHQLSSKLQQQLRSDSSSATIACASSGGIGADEALTSLNLHDVSARQVLDALLINSRYSMWLVLFEPQQPPSGDFSTTSLFRKSAQPDQPTWDFIQRYFDPLERKYRADWGFRN